MMEATLRNIKSYTKLSVLQGALELLIQGLKENSLSITEEKLKYQASFQDNLKASYDTSSFIVKSSITDEFYTQEGIKYLFKYLKIDNVSSKPTQINDVVYQDPFKGPFPEGMEFEENFCNLNLHRLLFTKYPILREQVLMVVRDFESQKTHLTNLCFRDIILLMNLINGVVFFNGGEKAGASQLRKHLQAAPYRSIYDKDFGIFQVIENEDNLNIIGESEVGFNDFYFYRPCTITQFNEISLKHILFKFTPQMTNSLSLIYPNDLTEATCFGNALFEIYNYGLNYLNLLSDDESTINDIVKDYSVLITHEWMMIVQRKEHDVILECGKLNLNSLAFFMIIVSRSLELIEEMKAKSVMKNVIAEL